MSVMIGPVDPANLIAEYQGDARLMPQMIVALARRLQEAESTGHTSFKVALGHQDRATQLAAALQAIADDDPTGKWGRWAREALSNSAVQQSQAKEG